MENRYTKEEIYQAFKVWGKEVSDPDVVVMDIETLTIEELAEAQTKYLVSIMESK